MPDRSQSFRLAGLLMALLMALMAAGLLTTSACSQQPKAGAPPATAAAGATAETSPGNAAAAPAAAGRSEDKPPLPEVPAPAPPDGKWLTDELGRRYFVDKVRKEEGGYIWLNPEKTQVQIRYGAIYDVVGEDEESFHVKIYGADPVERPGPAAITPEDRAKVAATYRNDTGKADRLQFEPFGHGLPERGQWRNGFEIADMNGDGHPDIVHGPERKGSRVPNIFLGDGKGNWRRWSEATFPPLPYDYGDVAVADFNGDGRPDLALAVHLSGLIALVADGPQSFKEWGRGLDFSQPSAAAQPESSFSSRAVTAADMNGDGRPDLIALGEGPRLTQGAGQGSRGAGGGFGMVVYFNQGDGTWVRRSEQAADKVRIFGDKLEAADFTRDGKLDIVLGSNVRGETGILRVGAEKGAWTTGHLEGLRRGFVGAVDVADFNRDGRLDLAIGYLSSELQVWRTGIDVFLGRADGTWERRGVAVEESRGWLTALDSGDLDGDGNLDLAGLTGEGQTWILLGKGDGSFVREESPEVPQAEGGCRGYDVQVADLDGQPGDEIVAEFAGEPSVLFAPTQCLDQGEMVAWKPVRRKP
ncbi:MAG: FG-GAP repeat domain-containing protein [Thermoanaerobaculia bacterium]